MIKASVLDLWGLRLQNLGRAVEIHVSLMGLRFGFIALQRGGRRSPKSQPLIIILNPKSHETTKTVSTNHRISTPSALKSLTLELYKHPNPQP